jgi:hypothetical protein
MTPDSNAIPQPLDKTLQEQVLKYLDTVRSELGDEEWKSHVKKQVLQAHRVGGTYLDFWREQLKDPKYAWVDEPSIKAQATSMPMGTTDMNTLLAQTFKSRMPGMKTQAQFTAFRAAFDAFEVVVNSIFSEDKNREQEGRKLLDQSLLACKQATEISRKLADVPEAATSKAADDFKKPPAEFQEYDIQQALLGELSQMKDFAELKLWYNETKARRDTIKSQMLRNVLMDAIRSAYIVLEKAAKAAENPAVASEVAPDPVPEG